MSIRKVCLIALIGLPAVVNAQPTSSSEQDALSAGRWRAGVAVAIKDSPYAGEGARITPFPLITYDGERFFFRGIAGGIHLFNGDVFSLDAMVQGRMDGIDADDFGAAALAENGIDRNKLSGRDHGLDAGLSATWTGRVGELEAELLADASDTSSGHEVSISYGYPMRAKNVSITPTIGLTWMSDRLANYYYGTLDKEVARGVVSYQPDAGSIAHAGVSFASRIGENWGVVATLEYRALADSFAASPLLGSDSTTSIFLGLARSF